MAVTVMSRETDTDKRLDDLNARVDSIDRRMETGFGEVREEFWAVRAEMKGESQAIRGEMTTGFASIRAEMAAQYTALNQTIYRLFGGMLVAWIVGIVAILLQT